MSPSWRIIVTVATNKERIDRLEKRQDKTDNTLFGNGSPGMDEDVRTLTNDVGQMKDDIKAIKNDIQSIKDDINLQKPVISELASLKKAIFTKFGIDAQGATEKLTLWEKIKPGLVEKLIIAVSTAFAVLVVSHWTELFK
jgi:hypothetical protein